MSEKTETTVLSLRVPKTFAETVDRLAERTMKARADFLKDILEPVVERMEKEEVECF